MAIVEPKTHDQVCVPYEITLPDGSVIFVNYWKAEQETDELVNVEIRGVYAGRQPDARG